MRIGLFLLEMKRRIRKTLTTEKKSEIIIQTNQKLKEELKSLDLDR